MVAAEKQNPDSPSDHDLLIRIDERVKVLMEFGEKYPPEATAQRLNKIDKCLSNHLKHHVAVTLAAIGALISAVAAIVVHILVRK